MRPLRRNLLLNSFKSFDLGVILVCLALSFHDTSLSRIRSSWADLLEAQVEMKILFLFIALGLIWVVIGHACGLYRSLRLSDGKEETPDVLKATFVSSLFLWPLGTLAQIDAVSVKATLAF